MNIFKIKELFKTMCFLVLIMVVFIFVFFDKEQVAAKYKEFLEYSKNNFGGTVYNKTDITLQITDYRWVRKLPPGKSSKDIGLFDVDSLIISEPMYFKEDIYFNGVLKFCDYSKLEIVKDEGVLEIKSKNTWVCKILNDFHFYDSIDDAF